MLKTKKKRRWLKRIVAASIISLLLLASLLMVCYMMIVYKPAGYHPVKLTAIQQKAANDKMTRIVTNMHNQLGAAEPFTLVLGKNTINHLLLIDTKDDKFLADLQKSIFSFDLDKVLIDPQITFNDGAAYLLSRQTIENKYLGTQTVVLAMGCKPSIIDNAKKIKLEILPFKLGAMPVPQNLIDKAVQRIDLQSKKNLAKEVTQIIRDQSYSFDNHFKSGDSFFSISDIRILDDRIELDFVPYVIPAQAGIQES